MELKDFVSQTLVEIIKGVEMAQQATKDSTGIVNPDHDMNDRENVQFDVAVTVQEGQEAKAGIVAVWGILGGAGAAKLDEMKAHVSRLQFSIPVFLPPGKKGR